MLQINEQLITKMLSVIDKGLVRGLGSPIPGHMCVEAAICYALDLPHSDDPGCVNSAIRALKIRLNDSSRWESNRARAYGLRKLAILQLGTKDNFDTVRFLKELVLLSKSTVKSAKYAKSDGLYFAKSAKYAKSAALYFAKAAEYAESAESAALYFAKAAEYAESAESAAKYVAKAAALYVAKAAEYAESAAKYAESAESAAQYAEYAAEYSAMAAEYSAKAAAYVFPQALLQFTRSVENILIDMKVPAVKYLYLLEKNDD